MERKSDPRTCSLCHKALEYANARMYGKNPCGRHNMRWDALPPHEFPGFTEAHSRIWKRFEKESLFPADMTLEAYVDMAFQLLEKAFQLDASTVEAFKRAMWYNGELFRPSFLDVDAEMTAAAQ